MILANLNVTRQNLRGDFTGPGNLPRMSPGHPSNPSIHTQPGQVRRQSPPPRGRIYHEDEIWLLMTLVMLHGVGSRLGFESERRQHPEASTNSTVLMDTTDGEENLKVVSVTSEVIPTPIKGPNFGTEMMIMMMMNTHKALFEGQDTPSVRTRQLLLVN